MSYVDINNTFINGNLYEDVYMDIPLDYEIHDKSRLVYKLQKSLYGLKQASRQWNLNFVECLLKEGFTQSKYDYSLFTKYKNEGFIIVLVYINDIVIGRNNNKLIDQFKVYLQSHFKLKDLGAL